MSDRNERLLQEVKNNKLSMDSTFQFSCQMCGNCCRKREEGIAITGLDVYRLAQSFGTTTEDILSKYVDIHLGPHSNLPVVCLRERMDGSCCLLRSGHCTVHSMKPVVCAVFPLGRGVDPWTSEVFYFSQGSHCCSHSSNGQTWTVKEWIALWNLPELDSMGLAWTKLSMGLSRVTCKLRADHITPSLIEDLKHMLYIDYDPNEPYEDQVEANIKAHIPVLRSKFQLKIDHNTFVFQ